MSTQSGIAASVILSLLLLFAPLAGAENEESVEYAVLRGVNSIRSSHGLQLLRPEHAAMAAAAVHAEELGGRMTLSHRGLDGTRVNDRYRLAGGTALRSGENLGAGDSIESIIRAWMDSSSHRSNILSPDWFHAGVGSYRLSGGRIILVVVFSDSRWVQDTITLSGNDLVISGKIVLRQGTVPETISIVTGNISHLPLSARKNTRDEMLLTFQIPRPANKDPDSKFSFFVNLVENQESLITDLVIVD